MFKDMLRVTVMGNLGSDAEVRFSARENRIASFRIAVNQGRTNAAGEREENAEWFRVSVMGRQAEYASHLVKGQRVLVAGRLQIARFQRQDGEPGIASYLYGWRAHRESPVGNQTWGSMSWSETGAGAIPGAI